MIPFYCDDKLVSRLKSYLLNESDSKGKIKASIAETTGRLIFDPNVERQNTLKLTINSTNTNVSYDYIVQEDHLEFTMQVEGNTSTVKLYPFEQRMIDALPPEFLPLGFKPTPHSVKPADESLATISPLVAEIPPEPISEVEVTPAQKPVQTEEHIITQIWGPKTDLADPLQLILIRQRSAKGVVTAQKIRLVLHDFAKELIGKDSLEQELQIGAETAVFNVGCLGAFEYALDLDRPDGHLAIREPKPITLKLDNLHPDYPLLELYFGTNGENIVVDLQRINQDGQDHFFVCAGHLSLVQTVLECAGHPFPQAIDAHMRFEVMTDDEGNVTLVQTPVVANQIGIQNIPLDKSTLDALDEASRPLEMAGTPVQGTSGVTEYEITVPLDVLFDFDENTNFVPGPQTLQILKTVFGEIALPDGTIVNVPRLVERQKLHYEIYDKTTGIILVLPMAWRGAGRPDAPFESDFSRPIRWYRAGENSESARAITDNRLRYVPHQRGFKLDWLDAGYGADRVKAFSLISVCSKLSPLLMGAMSTPVSKEMESSELKTRREIAQTEIDQFAANGLGGSINDYLPNNIYAHPRASVTGQKHLKLKYFANDIETNSPTTTPIPSTGSRTTNPEWLELSNMDLRPQSNELAINGFVIGTFGLGTGSGRVVSPPIKLLVRGVSAKKDGYQLIEIREDGSFGKTFLWNQSRGEVIEASPSVQAVDANNLSTLLDDAGIPRFDLEPNRFPKKAFNPRGQNHTESTVLDLDPAMRTISDEVLFAGHRPATIRPPRTGDPDWILETMLHLVDQPQSCFLPDVESSFGLTLTGRQQEIFRFVTPQAILEIPMVLFNGKYAVDRKPDPWYGVRGARLMLKDPSHAGMMVQVPVVFHSRRVRQSSRLEMILCLGQNQFADFDFEFLSCRNTLSRRPLQSLRLVSKNPVTPEIGSREAVFRQQARDDSRILLVEWAHELSLDQNGRYEKIADGNDITLDNGVRFNIGLSDNGEDHIRPTGIMRDENGDFVLGRAVTGQTVRVDLLRSERVGGLLCAVCGTEKKILTVNQLTKSEWFVFNHSRQLDKFFETVTAQRYPMLNRELKEYDVSGRSSAIVDKTYEAEAELSFTVKASLGRYLGASAQSLQTEGSGKPKLSVNLTANKITGQIEVQGLGRMSPDGSGNKERDVEVQIVALPGGVRLYANDAQAGYAWIEIDFKNIEGNWDPVITRARHCFYKFPYDVMPGNAGFLGALWYAAPEDVKICTDLLEEADLSGLRDYLRGSNMRATDLPDVLTRLDQHRFSTTHPRFTLDATALMRASWMGKEPFEKRRRQELESLHPKQDLPDMTTVLGREWRRLSVHRSFVATPTPITIPPKQEQFNGSRCGAGLLSGVKPAALNPFASAKMLTMPMPIMMGGIGLRV